MASRRFARFPATPPKKIPRGSAMNQAFFRPVGRGSHQRRRHAPFHDNTAPNFRGGEITILYY